ncbi:MAG: MBL fold metallo-hydrolase [Clostridiales bacterium]|nr:MBL fold metallo-hydrolase [Clostridiales bacterium]
MEIKKLVLGRLYTNCYFVINNDECIVIDSATNSEEILEFAEKLNVKIKAILLTHGHFDHCTACKQLQENNIKIYVSEHDGLVIENEPKNMGLLKSYSFKPDVLLKGDEELELIGLKIKVINTSGHTKGSVCYLINDVLFSGDTLFANGSYGRCDFYSGNFEDIKNSILNRLFNLSDNIKVLPGHGEATTIKQAKKDLTF